MQSSCQDLLLVKKQGEEQHYNVLPFVYLKRRGSVYVQAVHGKAPPKWSQQLPPERGIRV